MNNLFLYGASVKSKLIFDFLSNEGRMHEIAGIIDGDVSRKGQDFYGKEVIGDIDHFRKKYNHQKDSFCISLSENNFAIRSKLHATLDQDGFSPASIISKNALVSKSALVKKGSIIFPSCIVNGFTIIGSCVTLYTGVLIEHDCIIADNVEISPRCALAGKVEVSEGVFLGINSTILPYIKVGKNSIVGAGAVVTKDVQENSIVIGNPAKILRFRDS